MAWRDKLTERLLALAGLDFTIDLSHEAISRIRPTLFVGSRPGPQDTESLQQAGITHIVSCLPETKREAMGFLARDFDTLFLPLHDGMYEDIAATFPALFDFTDTARQQRMLVHCEVGVSRSGTLATALLMRDEQLSFFDAVQAVRAHRPGVLPNIGFASQLQRLEHELFADVADGHSSLARYLRQLCHVPAEIEVIEAVLTQHDLDAPRAIQALFDGDIPRVVQGARR